MTYNNTQRVQFDAIRTVAQGSITAIYQVLGPSFANPVRIIAITNDTNGALFISTDGVTDQMFVPASSFRVYDLNSNRLNNNPYFCLGVNTQLFVRYVVAPTTGNGVYAECLWGE